MDNQFYCSFKRDNNSRVKHIGPFSKDIADKYTKHYISTGYMWAETQTADEVYGGK